MLYEAQLVKKNNSSMQSDLMQGNGRKEAKSSAEQNYKSKWQSNKNWQSQYTTFDLLLEVSEYKIKP